MDTRFHVLAQVVRALKVPVTVFAVEVSVVALLLLVHVSIVFGMVRQITGLAIVRVGVMVFSFHMVIGMILAFEAGATSVAFVRPHPVIGVIHVLLASLPSIEAARTLVTLVSWSMMIEGIHMLIRCPLTTKHAVASFTFIFVVVRHVLFD